MPDPATLALPAAPTDGNLRPPRPSAVLVTVLQGHESLLAATPRSSTERPKVMALLAVDYRELFRASVAEGAATDDPAERDRLAKVARAANGAEVNHLTNLLAQYPKWCFAVPADASKPTGCADTWQYGLGRAHELGGRPDQARKVYLALIQAWPSSDSLPAAYFAFAEMFLAEAAADPSKLALAKQAYRQVVSYPPPDNRLWGHARLRLARIAWREGDFAVALSELKKTIEYGQTYASLPGAEAVAVAARADLVPVFALAGDPRRAHDFVRPLAGDAPASSARTFALLDDLRAYYRGAGRRTELVALDEDLVARDVARGQCERLAELVLFTGFGLEDDKDVVRGTAQRLVDVAVRLDTADDPEAPACTPATISLVTALAMAWDAEATGYVGGAPGSGDRATRAAAAELYRAVANGFTDAQVAAAPFSRQNPVDRRSRAELAARAALLDAN
jgi:tetratricopeptide (TPR) repeat protein